MAEDIKPLNLNSDQSNQVAPTVKQPQSTQPSLTSVGSVSGKKKMITRLTILVLLGIVSGYGLSFVSNKASAPKQLSSAEDGVTVGSFYGIEDEQAFKDEAEGELTEGGIDGEGSHHLVREGGESQYVYLTSSIIDLDQFVGRTIKIWGETFEAQQAGWLMDVGRLQVLE